MLNKKIFLIILPLFIFIIFSPYTITKLTVLGQEELLDEPKVVELIEAVKPTEIAEVEAVADSTDPQVIELVEVEKNIESPDQIAPIETQKETDQAVAPIAIAPEPVIAEAEKSTGTGSIEVEKVPEILAEPVAPEKATGTPDQVEDVVLIEEDSAETAQIPEISSTSPEIIEPKSSERAFDPAIAPGIVRASFLLADTGSAPNFFVRIKFVAVGEKIFETKTDLSGKMEIALASGRYYAEIIPENNNYRLQSDAPAFFLSANSEKDLGDLYLVKK